MEKKIRKLEYDFSVLKKEKSNKAREINFLRSENNKLMIDYQNLKKEFDTLNQERLNEENSEREEVSMEKINGCTGGNTGEKKDSE